MRSRKCPSCRDGTMAEEVIAEHETLLGGVPFVVPDARIWKCSHCDETVVSACEMKRWEAVQRDQLQRRKCVATPEAVKSLRQALNLPVSAFAGLLAVTRQTIHAWERPDSPGMSLGPGALLIRLLELEISRDSHGALADLARLARERGHAATAVIDSEVTHPRAEANRATSTYQRNRPDGATTFCVPACKVA